MHVSRATIHAFRATLAIALVAVTVLALAGPSPSQAGLPVLTVNDTGDAPDANAGDGDCLTAGGFCTLRAAIEEANGAGDRNEIRFALPLARARVTPAGTAYTIQPTTVLPAISNPAFIDGRTQKGYSGSPLIHLDGSLLTEGMGLYLQASNSLIAGLRISGFPDNPATPQFTYGAQIFVASGSADSSFEDNVLGLNGAGLASGSQMGIWLNSTTHMAVRNNVLSGSIAYGLYIAGGSDIDVTGNLIGLNEQGTAATPNDIYGIFVLDASNVSIGMNGLARAGDTGLNVISGNGVDGIHINGATGTAIAGNYIGTDITGSQDVGNGDFGVFVRESPDTSIGLPGMGNVISGNGDGPFEAGIFVLEPAPPLVRLSPAGVNPSFLNIQDNLIGTNAACDAAIPNENGVVVIDQPGARSLFWTEVLIDGNTISGNEGTASAPAAGTVTAEGSEMVAGDGIVWGALLPPGQAGLTISNGDIGLDCDGNPLGNSGDGMLLALEPALNDIANLAGAGPMLTKRMVRVRDVSLGHNGGDCIQGDIFTQSGPGRLGPAGDLGDILGLTAQWQDVKANDCGENGIEINQRVTSALSYTNESRVQLDDIEANRNGENGIKINQEFDTGGNVPFIIAGGVVMNENAKDGLNVERDIGTTVQGTTNAPVQVQNFDANNNGGSGVEVCEEEENEDDGEDEDEDGDEDGDHCDCEGEDPEDQCEPCDEGDEEDCECDGCDPAPDDFPIPFDIKGGETSGNGQSGSTVLDYIRNFDDIEGDQTPVTICRVSPADTSEPRVFASFADVSSHDNSGPGFEFRQVDPASLNPVASQGASCQVPLPAGVGNEGSTSYNNGGPAIDLGGDGHTENDPLDADVGPNGLTNYPVLTSASAGNSITITGTYDGAPNADIDLRFYSNTGCENGGEGEFYIGSQGIETDDDGHDDFEITFAEKNTPGRFVAATATGPEGVSEFSACIEGEGLGGISGDTDCDKDVDSVDGLNVLRDVAGFPPSKCIEAGNVDCDGDRDSVDSLLILRFVAGLPVNLPKGCPEIGT